nr:PREDICTED: C-type mannose receptor 2-like [Latimeria chalumnae]|eukprot:XP_014354214.1 PREDICTED: C-type mannose receptor 2-like [Latimeria chalumnae]
MADPDSGRLSHAHANGINWVRFTMKSGAAVIVLLLLTVTSTIAVEVVKEYILVKENLTWPRAQNYCRTHHKDLVSIHSKEEVKTLLEKYRDVNVDFLWIGLEKNASKDQWMWSSGEPVNFTNWGENQPNNAGQREDCVAIEAAATWHDYPCHSAASGHQFYFACFNGSLSSGDLKYHLIQEKKTWFEARDTCRKNYTDLVSITSQQEQDNIKNLVGSDFAWIGLYQNPWQWSNGDESSFQYWDIDEPHKSDKEGCVGIWLPKAVPESNNSETGKWNDFSCTTESYFLCYQEKFNLTLVKEKTTWKETLIYCRTNHTDLVSITGPEIQKQVAEVVRASAENRVWIRLHRERFSGYWFWMNEKVKITMKLGKDAAILFLFLVTIVIAVDVVKEFILLEKNLTWPNAQSYCRTHHKDLVSVHSKEEGKTLLEKYGDVDVDFLWIGLEKNAKKFILVKENKTWTEAFLHCQEHYTDLVSITDPQIQKEVAELAKRSSGDGVWIGLRKELLLGFLFWVNGNESDYSNWENAIQTDAQTEHCGYVDKTKNFTWGLQNNSGDGVWIGLRRDILFGFWFWMDGDESDYTNWENGVQTDPQTDHCGYMDKTKNSTWGFQCCLTELNFICSNWR